MCNAGTHLWIVARYATTIQARNDGWGDQSSTDGRTVRPPDRCHLSGWLAVAHRLAAGNNAGYRAIRNGRVVRPGLNLCLAGGPEPVSPMAITGKPESSAAGRESSGHWSLAGGVEGPSRGRLAEPPGSRRPPGCRP